MAPWTHMSIWQDGTIRPCCISHHSTNYGQLDQNKDLKNAWNNPKYKQLRVDMLEGKSIPTCYKCYSDDAAGIPSYRKNLNRQYEHNFHVVEQTQPDGMCNTFNLVYLDIKFSNLCNFKCRTCTPFASSSMAAAYKKHNLPIHHETLIQNFDWHHVENSIREICPILQEIYFAGGEPFLTKETYQLLLLLLEKKSDPILRFNTNLSTLRLQEYDAVDLLKNFSQVYIDVSIDHYGTKLEYIRNGSNWQVMQQNLNLLQNIPNIKLRASPTISIYNILDFDVFLNTIDNWFSELHIHNCLRNPTELAITSLPWQLKQQAKQALANIKSQHKLNCSINNVVNFMESKDTYLSHKQKFIAHNQLFDLLNNSNWKLVYPNLVEYYD